MKENRLKRAIDQGCIVAGMTLYTASPVLVEVLGYCGFDFVFIDTEHSALSVDMRLEHLIRAAEAANISTVVRVKANDEAMIRNAFEAGAQGVIIPHVKSRADVEAAIRSAKFPPRGIRGTAAEVRSACYGVGKFSWEEYIKYSNQNTMVIPLAEDKEFFDNIDEIIDVDGISAVNFGPSDLGMSLGLPLLYQLDSPIIKECFNKLSTKTRERNIPLMCPVAPPTLEKAKELVEKGVRMLILRNDIFNFQGICQQLINNIIEPLKKESLSLYGRR